MRYEFVTKSTKNNRKKQPSKILDSKITLTLNVVYYINVEQVVLPELLVQQKQAQERTSHRSKAQKFDIYSRYEEADQRIQTRVLDFESL